MPVIKLTDQMNVGYLESTAKLKSLAEEMNVLKQLGAVVEVDEFRGRISYQQIFVCGVELDLDRISNDGKGDALNYLLR